MDRLSTAMDTWLNSARRKYTKIHIVDKKAAEPVISHMWCYCVDNLYIITIYGDPHNNYHLMRVYSVNDVEEGRPKINYYLPNYLEIFHRVIMCRIDTFIYRKVYRRIFKNIRDWNTYDIDEEEIDIILATIQEAVL